MDHRYHGRPGKFIRQKPICTGVSNGTNFDEIYPMAKKSDAGQALDTFVMELGIPEELVVDRSKIRTGQGLSL